MASVGEKLRSARLEQGLDLAEVSVRTKISKRFLEAMEADERQQLPGAFFYRNWVQQYASSLSLNVDEIVAQVDSVLTKDAPPALPGQDSMMLPKHVRPAPLNVNGRDRGHRTLYSVGSLVAVVLGCSAFYAWWRNTQVHANAVLESSPVPASTAIARAAAEQRPAEPPQSSEAPRVIEKAPPPAPAAAPAPVPADGVHIEVSAIQQTWVSISPDGKQIFAGELKPTEVKTVDARDTARIRVGNAAGVSVSLNGKPIGPIGPEGHVRTVVFDKSGFHILEAKPRV